MKTTPQSPLNEYELGWLEQGRSLIVDEPPLPWTRQLVIEAAGVFAGGWDSNDNFLLLSNDGYTLTSVNSGERLFSNLDDSDVMFDHLSSGNLHFRVPETNETIDIFALQTGDGIRITSDGWVLTIIYPWWPQAKMTLYNSKVGGFYKTWRDVYGIKLVWIDNQWLRCGFSHSGEHFAIIGSSGAEIFSRLMSK